MREPLDRKREVLTPVVRSCARCGALNDPQEVRACTRCGYPVRGARLPELLSAPVSPRRLVMPLSVPTLLAFVGAGLAVLLVALILVVCLTN